LIVSEWPDFSKKRIQEIVDVDASQEVEWLITLISDLRSVRADMNIPPSKKAPLLMLADKLDPRLAKYAPQLSPMARVDGVETASEAPKGALQTVVDGVTYAIPLDGLIDKSAETARLSKEAEKAQFEIDKIDKKLSNKAFTDKAPEKVVNLQKERREGYVDHREVFPLLAVRDGERREALRNTVIFGLIVSVITIFTAVYLFNISD